MVEFRSSNTWGAAFCVDVLHDGVFAGHIRRQLATGVFRFYYRDVHDDLQLTFQDRDLEALKRRIRETSLPMTSKIHAAGDRLGREQLSDACDRLRCPRGVFRLGRALTGTTQH